MGMNVYLKQADGTNAPYVNDEKFYGLLGYGSSFPYIMFRANPYEHMLGHILPHCFMKDWTAKELKEQYYALELALRSERIPKTHHAYSEFIALREMLCYAAERNYSSYSAY